MSIPAPFLDSGFQPPEAFKQPLEALKRSDVVGAWLFVVAAAPAVAVLLAAALRRKTASMSSRDINAWSWEGAGRFRPRLFGLLGWVLSFRGKRGWSPIVTVRRWRMR
jgi:hypothetical protein